MKRGARGMNNARRILLQVLVMTVVSATAAAVAVCMLYRTAMDEQEGRLIDTARSQARLIEAVARFDATQSTDYPGGSTEATLSQVREAHAAYTWLGRTGEFTLARREGSEIVFLLRHRHPGNRVGVHGKCPFDSVLAEPMRRALSGRSGTVIGLDYRGETVLAAHEPVRGLPWGIVAKIDLAEVRAPFVRAALVALGCAAVLVLFGAPFLVRVTRPVYERARRNEEHYRATFEQAAVGIALVAPDGRWLRVNQRLCDITGYSREELLQGTFQDITHPDDLEADMEHVRRLLGGQAETYSMEKRYIRKDGIEVCIKLTVRLIRKHNADPDYFISVIEDITDRKQAEAALARHTGELATLNKSMVGREGRMIELKKEVNALTAELGREAPYPPVWEDAVAADGKTTDSSLETRGTGSRPKDAVSASPRGGDDHRSLR